VTAARDIVVVGASAGGVEALSQLVRGLPPGLPGAVFVVCHFPPGSRSMLPDILSRQGPLLARHARDGEPIYPGHIYVAPPDRHLILEEGEVLLTRGPREHYFRPAIDPLFRSAARAYGPRVVGILLSGALLDGVAGLLAVRSGGGLAVVQDPDDALLPSLPQSALEIVGADHVAPAGALAALLVSLIHQPIVAQGEPSMADPIDRTAEAVQRDMQAQTHGDRRGAVSVFTCPECGGCLWQVDEKELLRFRCHVGHIYLGETLMAEQSASLEAALWVAVRTFKEKTILSRQLAARAHEARDPVSAARFEEEARLAEHYAGVIHQYLLQAPEALPGGTLATPPPLAPKGAPTP
jgi:two-component system chemotaxis response regulator CheB